MLFNANAATNVSKKFEFVGTIESQLHTFSKLRESDPERARIIFENGNKLVEHARAGEYRKIKKIVQEFNDGEFLMYSISQMMLASLLEGHLMITQFILDQGYPINNCHIPNALFDCLLETSDSNGATVVDFLSAKLFDINRQQEKTWLAPIHIAVRRNMFQTLRALLNHGADANSVAKDDVMPLNIAEEMEDGFDKKRIIGLLNEHGAKSTWKKGNHSSDLAGAPMETKLVSFSGGCGPPKVSMKGQHTTLHETSTTGSIVASTPNLRTFKGGETAVTQQPTLNNEKSHNLSSNSGVVGDKASYSEDGAMLFSTT